jgi:Xaa-Pro aminopeptidase
MDEAMEALEPGMTERELANDWRARVCEKGGQPIDGFLTVGFGSRTAYTHPLPGDREIQRGDLVRWDGGCRYEQYCSDIGRTFAFGSADDDDVRKYEALYSGLEASLSEFGDGVETGVVFESGVDAVRSSGVDEFSEFEPFHLGHGIGVEIYDPPTIVTGAGTLERDMVMCVEPPYNELGSGGFLIEDEVVVTEDGYEKLTDAPETLPVVG